MGLNVLDAAAAAWEAASSLRTEFCRSTSASNPSRLRAAFSRMSPRGRGGCGGLSSGVASFWVSGDGGVTIMSCGSGGSGVDLCWL